MRSKEADSENLDNQVRGDYNFKETFEEQLAENEPTAILDKNGHSHKLEEEDSNRLTVEERVRCIIFYAKKFLTMEQMLANTQFMMRALPSPREDADTKIEGAFSDNGWKKIETRKVKKLTGTAISCPDNNLEYKTEEGYCALSAHDQDTRICQYQSMEKLEPPETDKEYCRRCEYSPQTMAYGQEVVVSMEKDAEKKVRPSESKQEKGAEKDEEEQLAEEISRFCEKEDYFSDGVGDYIRRAFISSRVGDDTGVTGYINEIRVYFRERHKPISDDLVSIIKKIERMVWKKKHMQID